MNMQKIVLTNITSRGRNIQLIKAIRQHTGLLLADAKKAVENLLEGKRVEISVHEENMAAFTDEAEQLGILWERNDLV